MYIGVKELISELKQPFDRLGKAVKKAKANLKERGESVRDKKFIQEEVELILAEWDRKRDRGIIVHEQLCQKELKDNSKAVFEGYTPSLYQASEPILKSESKLENNTTYLEKKLVSNKYKVLGFADKIDIYRSTINITDNKTTDKIYRSSSFKSDKGFQVAGAKMSEPISHLDDCNYNDAVLQLSLYMYLAWENNKHLKIGKLFIRHIKLNEAGKKVADTLIPVPYMKDEVKKILKYRLLNNEG